MMDCTDRHDRYFLRLISKNVMLYTEMVVTKAVLRGDKHKLLKFNNLEKPLANFEIIPRKDSLFYKINTMLNFLDKSIDHRIINLN